MQFTFLGTGTSSGLPLLACQCSLCTSSDWRDKRLRCAGLLEWGDKTIVIDTGLDFRQQMLRENINRIDSVLITHAHIDHIGGLDELRAYNFAQQEDMIVYADTLASKMIKHMYSYVFAEKKYPGAPKIELNTFQTNTSFNLFEKKIHAIEILHGKMPITGFRIDDFAYLTDVKHISETSFQLLKGTKTLVISAVRIAEHHSHLNLDEALSIIDKLNVEKAYLIHISHNFAKHSDIEKMLPKNVFVAYDGLKIEL